MGNEMGAGSSQNRPYPRSLPEAYVQLVRSGYFDKTGVIRQDFLVNITKELPKRFDPGVRGGLKSAQLRNYYNHLKMAEGLYDRAYLYDPGSLDKTENWLIRHIQKMEGLIHYAKSKPDVSIPDSFFDFINENVGACKSAKDVIEGWIPHYQAVIGFFKYYEQLELKSQQQNRFSNNQRR